MAADLRVDAVCVAALKFKPGSDADQRKVMMAGTLRAAAGVYDTIADEAEGRLP